MTRQFTVDCPFSTLVCARTFVRSPIDDVSVDMHSGARLSCQKIRRSGSLPLIVGEMIGREAKRSDGPNWTFAYFR